MKIRGEQLEERLARGLAPVYLLWGNEPLQREECLDRVRGAARGQGHDDRVVLHAEPGFQWERLLELRDSLSLFAEKRTIDLRLPSSRPGTEGAAALRAYAERPNPDAVLIVTVAHLVEWRDSTTQWFKSLEQAGVSVQVEPIPADRLPGWIRRRAAAAGIELSEPAAALLAERSEGNLLACMQEIDKLALLAGGPVDVEELLEAVSDSARFGPFDLVDAALAGDSARVVRIVRALREEGAEPLAILGSVAWALRGVAAIAAVGVDAAMRDPRFGAWRRRRAALAAALRRLPRSGWAALLRQAYGVDRVAKGIRERGAPAVHRGRDDAWDALERLVLAMSGAPVCGPSAPRELAGEGG